MKQCYRNPAATEWYRDMAKDPADFPFLFTYGGTDYEGFGALTLVSRESKRTAKREDNIYRYTLDSLAVTLIFTHYPAYGISESTIWFENTGDADSKVLENLRQVWKFAGDKPVLKGILGDHGNQYRPYETDLTAENAHFVSDSGRPTHGNFPYYNLEYGDGGAMLAIGWAGTFTADFSYADGVTTYTVNSVNNMKTYLKPGEKVRTALFVIAPYQKREPYYAANFWRSWFVDCNLPPLDNKGTELKPMSFHCMSGDTGLPNSDGSISERYFTWRPTFEKMAEVGVKVDVRWFDAGWYIAPDLTSPQSDWWGTVGTWELDQYKWPGKTFLESTDYAREHGMRTLMWFEPERVTDVENLAKNFGYNPDWAIRREGVGSISNNIGIPECYDWTVGRIYKTLRDNKVEIYREDNNSDPGALWRYLDTLEGDNRTGITECKFVDGHYRMWDDIIECTLSFGGCGFCDSCASGGGRNDLETIRRGVPLLRSDADRTTTALRLSMSWGFNQWIPYCGANTKEKVGELDATGQSDVYTWRASYLPALNVDSQFTQDPDQDFSILRFGLDEWAKVNPYLLKDFYPMTPWHHRTDRAGFTAFGYNDPETDKGLMLLFRMEDCEDDTLTVTVPWMEPGCTCRLTDEDTGETWTADSAEMSFQLADKRTSRLIWTEKI